jgi:mannosyltransferase OCH1-like enzyme
MIVQGLWVGGALSTMERLSISSFLANGHDYHLYVYRDVSGVPEGATIRDASTIVSESRIGNFSWLAEFSDLFRYALLLERGGIWADLDVICLRPFRIRAEYLFPRTPCRHARPR